MNRFAALLDGLLLTPSRNGKLRLMQEYFATRPDPERGWALAALTGELSFAAAKPSQIRALAAERVDPELLDWSFDFVGDLAETVSLIWPEPAVAAAPAPVPGLGEIVESLHRASRAEVAGLLAPWLDALDATGRWALLKLVTGSLRIGVSARLAKTALAEWGGVAIERIEEAWHGLTPPYQPLFDWLEGRCPLPETGDLPNFCPLMLAQPLEDDDFSGLDPADYVAEWKWAGSRNIPASAEICRCATGSAAGRRGVPRNGSLLLLEAGERQRAGAVALFRRVMYERLFASMGDPDFVGGDLVERRGQLIPIGVVGDHQGQLDAARLGALAHPHPA